MILGQYKRAIKNSMTYCKDNGPMSLIVRCLGKLGLPDESMHKIERFYNPYINQNIYIPDKNFDGEFQPWEKELQSNCHIAVQCHVFYTDLFTELKEKLNNIPYAYDLYITTDNEKKAEYINKELGPKLKKARYAEIKVLPNRGRDIIPFLKQMHPVFDKYDYLCHVHTKKSLHDKDKGDIWRRVSYDALLGSIGQIRQLFKLFHGDEKIGLLFPHITQHITLHIDWAVEKGTAESLLRSMDFKNPLPDKIIFPPGNMIWAKTKAIKQLLTLDIGFNEIPPEEGQITGTVMHAIERLWVYIARENGYDFRQIDSQERGRKA